MLWLYDEDDAQLLLEGNLSKKLLALFFACFFYLLLLLFLFVEILVSQKQEGSLIPRGNDLLDHLPRRAAPARIVQVPPHRPHHQPQQYPGGHSGGTTPPPIAKKDSIKKQPQKAAIPKEPTVPASIPIVPTKTVPLEKIPPNGARRGDVITPLEKSTAEIPSQEPLPSRRGRSSWVKKEQEKIVTEIPQYAEQAPNQTDSYRDSKASPFSDFSTISQNAAQDILFENQNGGPGGQPSFGLPSGNPSAAEQSKRFEIELFMTRFVRSVCDSSRQNPLRLRNERIPEHLVAVAVTINRERHIEAFSFTQRSPYPTVNHYLEEMINEVTPPKIPESWGPDTLKVPLRIYIYSTPETSEIWLVPRGRE